MTSRPLTLIETVALVEQMTYGVESGCVVLGKKPLPYIKPTLNISLNFGFRRSYAYNHAQRFEHFLHAIIHQGLPLDNIQVISLRHEVRLLMAPPWEDGSYACHVIVTKKCVFLHRILNESLQDRPSHWGYKFEQLCTNQGIQADVTPNDNVNSIVQASIGNYKTLIACEIDAIEGQVYIELKLISNHIKTISRNRFQNFWIQCYLSKVKKLAVGFRSKNGVLKHVKMYSTKFMLEQCGKGFKEACIHRWYKAMEVIMSQTQEKGRHGVYTLTVHEDTFEMKKEEVETASELWRLIPEECQ